MTQKASMPPLPRRSPAEGPATAADDALAPGLIHEMRQPLMAVKTGLQLLARSFPAAAQADEWGLVLAQLARLEEIFHGYQSFLRPDRDDATVFELGPTVETALVLVRYRLRGLGARFAVELPAGPVRVSGSPSALTHGLVNLLTNSLDSLDEASWAGRLLVRVLPRPELAVVQVRVSDEGGGIAPAVRATLFQAALSTKGSKGSGIGLTVVGRMMAAYDGRAFVVADDDPLRVPWARAELCLEMPTKPRPPLKVPEQAPTAPLAGLEVLLVEDEPSIAALLSCGLEAEGARVTAVGDGTQAAALLGARRFDVLLSDKNLPGVNGVELAAQARALSPHMTVVLMTAYASRESAHRSLEIGVDDYLEKPFELDELIGRIVEIRQRTPLEREPLQGPRVAIALTRGDEVTAMAEAVKAAGGTPLCVGLEAALALVPPAEVLVLPGASISLSVRREIWKARVTRPGLRIVVVSDSASLSAELVAIGVAATAHLFLPLEKSSLAATFRPLLGGDR